MSFFTRLRFLFADKRKKNRNCWRLKEPIKLFHLMLMYGWRINKNEIALFFRLFNIKEGLQVDGNPRTVINRSLCKFDFNAEKRGEEKMSEKCVRVKIYLQIRRWSSLERFRSQCRVNVFTKVKSDCQSKTTWMGKKEWQTVLSCGETN